MNLTNLPQFINLFIDLDLIKFGFNLIIMSDTIRLNTELNNVDFEDDTSSPRRMFIENIKYDSVIFVFIIFTLFNSIYTYAGICSPSPFNTTSLYYPLVQNYSNDEASVIIHLEPLHIFHRFINMNGKALRHSTKYPVENILNLKGKITYLKDGSAVDEKEIVETNLTHNFNIGVDKSSGFHIFNQPIYSTFNALNISLIFKTGFYNIRGFEFTYTFLDPSAYNSISNSVKLILSSSACYALITFIFVSKKHKLTNFQFFSIILGIAATLAPNPLTLFANNQFISFLSIFFPVVFLLIFRVFQVYINVSIYYHSDKFPQKITLISLAFLAIYEICEFCVSNYRNNLFLSNPNKLTGMEKLLIALHVFYCIANCFTFGYFFVKTFDSADLWHFKSCVYGIFSIATSITTLVTEVVLPINNLSSDTTMRINLYLASHIFANIVFLFFHHTVDDATMIEEKVKIDPLPNETDE